jgi:hypothetical protein
MVAVVERALWVPRQLSIFLKKKKKIVTPAGIRTNVMEWEGDGTRKSKLS